MIPKKELAAIMMDFYVTDQWFLQNSNQRLVADTCQVYEPILNRYGYSTEDYIYSINRYMADPEELSKILKQTGDRLDKEVKRLRDLRDFLREEEIRLRHEPWDPVDFEKKDYLAPEEQRPHQPLVLQERYLRQAEQKTNNEKDIRKISIPFDRHVSSTEWVH